MWIHRIGLEIGNTCVSAAMVVSVFFISAALGNLTGCRLLRINKKPLTIYGISEICTGISSAILFPVASVLYLYIHPFANSTTVTWPINLLYALSLAGIPAFFTGISFPAISDAFINTINHRTESGGKFYAGNLIGAAIGVIAGGIILPKYLGYTAAFFTISIIFIIIGITAIYYSRRINADKNISAKTISTSKSKKKVVIEQKDERHINQNTRTVVIGIAIIIGSGIFSIMLEMLIIAYFQQMATGSLYVISSILFAFILNLGIGSLLASTLRKKGISVVKLLSVMLIICGILALVYPLIFNFMLEQGIFRQNNQINYIVIISALILAPFLISVGTIFPLAWEMIETAAKHQGQAMGHASVLNKIGSAVGAIAGPFILVPVIGLTGAVMSAGCGYLVLAIFVKPEKQIIRGIIFVAIIVCTWLTWGKMVPFKLQNGETLKAIYQGPDGVVGVVDDDTGSRHIVLNGTYTLNGTGRAYKSQQHESWVPLLFTPNPQRVTFIGMASGISADAALDFPISHLDAIELVPDVVKAAKQHFNKWNNRLFTDKRANVIINDGRYVISSSPKPYDTIIIDLLHPALEGTASLYSADFLSKVSGKLTPDGLCCLWLPLYQLNEELAGIILKTFINSFPSCIAVRGNFDPGQPIIGLIGANRPINISDEYLQHRLHSIKGNAGIKSSPFMRSTENARLLLLGDLKNISEDFKKYPQTTDNHPAFVYQSLKYIPENTVIRGIKLLYWFGNRFKSPEFPSCYLGNTPADKPFRGINAGNNYYAASVFRMPLNDDIINSTERNRTSQAYIIRARTIAPQTDIMIEDLGQ